VRLARSPKRNDMHPSDLRLLAYCDGEAGGRIARHLAGCRRCRERLEQIRTEKAALAAAHPIGPDQEPQLTGLFGAISAWQSNESNGARLHLRRRVRERVETFCGAAAVGTVDHPGVREEKLLGTSNEIFDAFLGPAAAEVIQDDLLRELRWNLPLGETNE